MERYRILPHTADGKFQAFGKTMEEAFANAALATASLMWDWTKIVPRKTLGIEIAGKDLEQLLIKFLGEIVYLAETKKFLLAAVDRPEIIWEGTGFRLRAGFRGDGLSKKTPLHGVVKAVTYNEMKIEFSGPCGYTIQVVVDM
jgi:SHS2 domain-containing protein